MFGGKVPFPGSISAGGNRGGITAVPDGECASLVLRVGEQVQDPLSTHPPEMSHQAQLVCSQSGWLWVLQ